MADHRKYLGRYFTTTHLRANVTVQRGEGGAPLLNMNGEAVASWISTLDQGSASFACPIEAAEKVRKDFVRLAKCGLVGVGSDRRDGAGPAPGLDRAGRLRLFRRAGGKGRDEGGDMILEVGARKSPRPEI